MFDWMWKKHRKAIIIFLLASILFPVVLYLILLPSSPIPAGSGLRKTDWLVFLGSYLSFLGTVAVAAVSLAQSSYHNEMENRRREEERHKEIQPLFSIEIVAIDKLPPGTGEAIDLSGRTALPKHKNVLIQIEIANSCPAKHVIIFDAYYLQPVMKPGEKKTVCVGYEDSRDVVNWPKKVLKLLKSEVPCDDQGIPIGFNIVYEDVDGHQMMQSFDLQKFEEKKYYALHGEPVEV